MYVPKDNPGWWTWLDQTQRLLKEVKIQDGWELLLKTDTVYKDLKGNGRLFLQIQFDAPDNETGVVARQYCRKWYLSPHMTKQEVVRTAYKAYQHAVLHEAAEKFTYRGACIYSPHYDVDVLADGLSEDKRENH